MQWEIITSKSHSLQFKSTLLTSTIGSNFCDKIQTFSKISQACYEGIHLLNSIIYVYMDRCKWRKMIKEARWSGWVWVGECFFWYRPTRVVPDQRLLNGRCCCCCFSSKLLVFMLPMRPYPQKFSTTFQLKFVTGASVRVNNSSAILQVCCCAVIMQWWRHNVHFIKSIA